MTEVHATDPTPEVQSWFEPGLLEALRVVLTRSYRLDEVEEALGLAGRAALSRGDHTGAARVLSGRSPTETLIRLFVLGRAVPAADADAAFEGAPVAALVAAGLLDRDVDTVSARLDLRPYGQLDSGADWWVLSDLAADVRPGTLGAEHVLGVGSAGTTLAQATVRRTVARALDVGTGCGVQALHLSQHCADIVATDLSPRALRMASTTAALSGVRLTLRQGSLLDPVRDEQFDLVVSNPPFIVGPGFTPGAGGFRYRDSGFASDEVCRRLISGLPSRLAPSGLAQLLANWAITAEQDWAERVAGWVADAGVDAWVWQREVADPGEYVGLWLRDAGHLPGTPEWVARYDAWLDWFGEAGVIAVGMGMVSLRRTDGPPVVMCEDVPQALEQPIAPAIAAWFDRVEVTRGWSDDRLLDARLRPSEGLVLSVQSLPDESGWRPALTELRQRHGLRWTLEADELVATVVAGCQNGLPLRVVLQLLAAARGLDPDALETAMVPVARDLIGRGFLLPV